MQTSRRRVLAVAAFMILLSLAWQCEAGKKTNLPPSFKKCKAKIKSALSIVNSIESRPEDLPWASYKDPKVRSAIHDFTTAVVGWPSTVSDELSLKNAWTDKDIDDMEKSLNEYRTSHINMASASNLVFDDDYVPSELSMSASDPEVASQAEDRGEGVATGDSTVDETGIAKISELAAESGDSDESSLDNIDGIPEDRLDRIGYVRYRRFGLSFIIPECKGCASSITLARELLPQEVLTLSEECSDLVKRGLDYYDYMALLLLGQKKAMRIQGEYARSLTKNFHVEAPSTFWRIQTGGDMLRNTMDMDVIYAPPGIIAKFDPPKPPQAEETELSNSSWSFLWSWVSLKLTPGGSQFDNYVASIQGFRDRRHKINIRQCSLAIADEARLLAQEVPKGSPEEAKRRPRMISKKLAQMLQEGGVSLADRPRGDSDSSTSSASSRSWNDSVDGSPNMRGTKKSAVGSINDILKKACEADD